MKYKSKIYENPKQIFDAWEKFESKSGSSVYPVVNFLYSKKKMTGCYFELDIRTKKHIEDFEKIKKVIDILDEN